MDITRMDMFLSPHANKEEALKAQEKDDNITRFNGEYKAQPKSAESSQATQLLDESGQAMQVKDAPSADNPADAFNVDTDMEATTPTRMRTGYSYFDDKIDNGTLSIFDGYIAKNYLGIDLNVYAQIDLNANVKSMSGTQSMKNINDTFKSLDTGSNLLANSEDNTGTWEGIVRGVNSTTNGFIGMNEDRSKFATNLMQYVYGQARVAGQGRITNAQIQDAKKMYDAGFKDKEQFIAQIGQGQREALIYLDNLIQEHQAKGFPIPPDIIAKYNYYQAQVKAIERDSKSFNQKDFHKNYFKGQGR